MLPLQEIKQRALDRISMNEKNSDPSFFPWEEMLDAIDQKDESAVRRVLEKYPDVKFY